MLELNKNSLKSRDAWEKAGIRLPGFDLGEIARKTNEAPAWIHFGAGNIFRGFIAVLQQTLLDAGKAETGIIAVETYDFEIIDKIYEPFDNLSLLATMKPDGSLDKKVVGSVTDGLAGDYSRKADWERLLDFFTRPSLQLASFTITEKGYGLKGISGEYLPGVVRDMANGPEKPEHIMAKVASLIYARFKSGAAPLALVSMDNCSHNGEKLHEAVSAIAAKWAENRLVEAEFLQYVNDPQRVSFPWTMIDKITPRPSPKVRDYLDATGFKSTEIIQTAKNTFIAPFVNAEAPEYLVVEDRFPNGRMPLEAAGVLFADRQTVDRVEKMKVCTCLNPLHTSLAVFGCLLGYTLIADEMKDAQLKRLVEKVGYAEGLPVVVNPGILDPEAFIREVIEERLPNPYIPDTPQRIATDTSQKMGIRFGETIKAYCGRKEPGPGKLVYIPLVIAGWCRYLMGVDDNGQAMPLSPDAMLEELRPFLAEVRLGEKAEKPDVLKPVLSNTHLFGLNLYEAGLGEKIEGYFWEMAAGKGAVRRTLEKYL